LPQRRSAGRDHYPVEPSPRPRVLSCPGSGMFYIPYADVERLKLSTSRRRSELAFAVVAGGYAIRFLIGVFAVRPPDSATASALAASGWAACCASIYLWAYWRHHHAYYAQCTQLDMELLRRLKPTMSVTAESGARSGVAIRSLATVALALAVAAEFLAPTQAWTVPEPVSLASGAALLVANAVTLANRRLASGEVGIPVALLPFLWNCAWVALALTLRCGYSLVLLFVFVPLNTARTTLVDGLTQGARDVLFALERRSLEASVAVSPRTLATEPDGAA
jgi:hypothetical protein